MIRKEDYIRSIWANNAVMLKHDPFTLKSGRTSYIYINHRNYICSPNNLSILVELLHQQLLSCDPVFANKFALCNVGSSVSPFLIGAVCSKYQLPFYFHREVNKEKGVKESLFSFDYNPSSELNSRLPAILIDDVITTASTVLDTALCLRNNKIEVKFCLTLVDRRIESEKEPLEFAVKSCVTLADIIIWGLENGMIDTKLKDIAEIELDQTQN